VSADKPLTYLDRVALKRVAERHIKRFESRLSSGHAAVRVAECKMYLDLWQDILQSVCSWYDGDSFPIANFTRREREEVLEAYASGEFDE